MRVVERVKSLPGFHLAAAQWEAQGGAMALRGAEAGEATLAQQEALAQAVVGVETVATSPQGPLAVMMLKKGLWGWRGEGAWGSLRPDHAAPPGRQPAGGTE